MFFLPTEYLFAMRRAVIFWTTLVVAPFEPVFDAVEDELEARGHRVGHDAERTTP
jgi:hypothetical protein